MLNNGVPSPPLISLYIDELEPCLDEINKDSPCLFSIVIAIPLYANNVVLNSRPRACLQRLLNKQYKFCTSSSLEVSLSPTQIMIFGRNKRNLNQEAIYLNKDQFEITHEYKYLGIKLNSHGYFEPSSKRHRILGMKALMGTLWKEVVVRVTCWELKSHQFKALVLLTLKYSIKIWGGNLKNFYWEVFEKAMKMHMMSHIKVCYLTTYHILLVEFKELPIE